MGNGSSQSLGSPATRSEEQLLAIAEERGHGARSKAAMLGAGFGALLGSFVGPFGAAAGGALGAWLGANVGDEIDAEDP